MGLRIGQEIASGQYQVTKELGQGRNCVSYLVRDCYQHNWAIKTLQDEVWEGLSPEDRDRVQNKLLAEAMMLAKLQHPHIVRFKEPLTENGRVYLVMEHIAGDDLATISPRTLPEDDALLYVQQIASALHAVHEAKLLHRDIKPANIMLRAGKPEAVLIDFGLSKGFDRTLTASSVSTTDGFAPPELYDPNEKPQAYSDVYGLAATLYVLLTGEVPPSALERVKWLRRRKKLKPPQQINSTLRDRTSQGIMKGLELDYTKRPQTIREFLALFDLSLDTTPSTSSVTNPIEQESLNQTRAQTRIGQQTLYATIIIGVLSVIITIVLTLFSEDIKNWLRPSPVDSTPSSESID